MAKTLEQLEAELLTVTDQVGRLMDQVLQKGYVPVFRCGHSGLLLPSDYLQGWGRLYGISMGPEPVSEVLDSDYETAPPDITPDIRRIEQIMHPVGPCRSQVDFLLVAPSEFDAKKAILARDDEDMYERARIVRARQLVNPRGRLRIMQAKWEAK